ncbi:hypothetical protein GCM10027446_18020 [Angustibacter peucedani]
MDPVLVSYVAYSAVSIALTAWVARTLFRNGALFLVDVFDGDEKMARAVNHLLVVGFWLINLGYVAFALKIGDAVPDARSAVEALSRKLGGVLLVLGAMHFGNLFVLSRLRRHNRLAHQPVPPVPPSAQGPANPWQLPGSAAPQQA